MTRSPNISFSVELPDDTSHAFVTEAGEVLPFAASFDETLGGVRAGVLGQSDLLGAWYPEAGLRSRVPEAKAITAYLDSDDPYYEARFIRLLRDARELWLPDGDMWPLHFAELSSRPGRGKLELVVFTTGPYPQQPFLDLGTLNLALPTESSTPERPLYGFDAAGSIRAPLRAKRVTKGSLEVSAYLTGVGVQPLVSVGTPVAADGSGVATSVSLSVQDDNVVALVGGVRVTVPLEPLENNDTTFVVLGVPASITRYLSAVLTWRNQHARLTAKSSLGTFTAHATLPTSLPDLSEQVLTAGVRADGLAIASYLSEPVFTHRYLDESEAEQHAEQKYADMTDPTLDWSIQPPDISLIVARLDTKPLEVAPGESLTFDASATRTGGYVGALQATLTLGNGLTGSFVVLSDVSGVAKYRITVAAPSTTPEGAYVLRFAVKAPTADEPGSLLANARGSIDGLVEVAAGPAIMPNPTFVLRMNDSVNKSSTTLLTDTSGNSNSFLWRGGARPNREYTGVLATGKHAAAIRCFPLVNNAQAHRLASNQAYCLILTEASRTAINGVYFSVTGANSANGARIIRAEGGFAVQAVNGSAVVTSPDTIPFAGGREQLILNVETSEVALYERVSGRRIALARPVWPDEDLRVTTGAVRAADGTLTNVSRAHVLASSAHPYAFTPLQRRRNMDELLKTAPTSTLAQYPDIAVAIFKWDDGRKYVNDGAPDIPMTATPFGTVNEIPGGVYPQGGAGTYIRIETGIPNTEVTTVFTAIKGFADSSVGPYDGQIAFADSSRTQATAKLARHETTQPFALIRNNDYNHTYGTVGPKPVPSISSYKIVWNPPAKSFSVRAFYSDTIRTVKSDNSYPGSLVIGIGGEPRANGTIDDPTKTQNLELVICRGVVDGNEETTMKTILPS